MWYTCTTRSRTVPATIGPITEYRLPHLRRWWLLSISPISGVTRIAPWPHRVFDGTSPDAATDLTPARPGLSRHYTTLLANIMNMLGDIDQPIAKVERPWLRRRRIHGRLLPVCTNASFPTPAPAKTSPAGVNAKAVDMSLPDFMGLAMPLIQHGLPVRPVPA